jgi:hypothetical protein
LVPEVLEALVVVDYFRCCCCLVRLDRLDRLDRLGRQAKLQVRQMRLVRLERLDRLDPVPHYCLLFFPSTLVPPSLDLA